MNKDNPTHYIRRIKKLLKYIYFCYLNFFWALPKSGGSDNFKGTAHVLLVKNIEYVAFAKICANSFLNFHQNSKVVVHCDSITYDLAKSRLSSIFLNRRIEVLKDQSKSKSWQILKTRLIISLSNSHDIYMDADLRWRSSVQRLQTLTFFVNEFDFRDNVTFAKLLDFPIFKELNNPIMRNTSFVTFGGIEAEVIISKLILETVENFSKILKTLNVTETERIQLDRLSEQISISLLSERVTSEIKFLKNSDSRLDKGIVESPYFGATGLGF